MARAIRRLSLFKRSYKWQELKPISEKKVMEKRRVKVQDVERKGNTKNTKDREDVNDEQSRS